jgi:hypothetical protein
VFRAGSFVEHVEGGDLLTSPLSAPSSLLSLRKYGCAGGRKSALRDVATSMRDDGSRGRLLLLGRALGRRRRCNGAPGASAVVGVAQIERAACLAAGRR